jgi:hypothetical protein
MVFALAGDSTTTIFMKIQAVKGIFRPLSGCTGSRESTARWVMEPALSNNPVSGWRVGPSYNERMRTTF